MAARWCQVIPAEAVEAAARVLLGYTGACVCHEAYTGRNLIDPDCRYHDVPPEVAKEILEAAAPYMLAEAWDEGYTLGYADCANKQESNRPNPYMLNNEGEK